MAKIVAGTRNHVDRGNPWFVFFTCIRFDLRMHFCLIIAQINIIISNSYAWRVCCKSINMSRPFWRSIVNFLRMGNEIMKTGILGLFVVTSLSMSCGRSNQTSDNSEQKAVGAPTTKSDRVIVARCSSTAAEKLKTNAQNKGCTIDSSQIKSQHIDNRWYNPTSYVWYSVTGLCKDNVDENLTVLVQYSGGRCY